jgi:DNA polymerase-3 subunit alpha
MPIGVPQLRVRSSYSLAQGASSVSDIVARAASLSMPAIALCDHHNLFGSMEFCKYATGKGVQPIVGMRAKLFNEGGKGGWLTLLAQNENGFSNLSSMLKGIGVPSAQSLERKLIGETTRLPRELLREKSGDIICLWGGGEDGYISALSSHEAGEEIDYLKQIFGNRLYAEICRTNVRDSVKAKLSESEQIALAMNKSVPLVGTWDCWYATPDRHKAWVLLAAMSAEPRRELVISDEGLAEGGEPIYGIPSTEEFRGIFSDLPEAIRNTYAIAQRTAFSVRERPPMLPPFPTLDGRSEAEELKRMAVEGLKKRLDKKRVEEKERNIYRTRLDFEISVIERMGFSGYFLIVADFIQWAKRQGIPVGPGRGSGAGSVAAWALSITDLDPLEFGLLFERFLNPDRVSMPDFDIDFCEDRRDEVIQYVRHKYGEDRVAYIATFGIIRGKTALRDTHRVLRHDKLGSASLREIDRVSKLIPKKEDSAEPMGLLEAQEKVPEFRNAVSAAVSPTIAMTFDMAKEVEGLFKSRGQHAAGVVIADRALESLIPVITDEKTGAIVTGYSLKGVEAAGLVKFDFLGLTTLSILEEARRHIKITHGYDIDFADIPRDDPEVMKGLARGDTTGVFQFETGGMRNVLKQIKVSNLKDLIAVVALFRPGPMAYIDLYADRKNGRVPTEYPKPAARTEPFLKETFGIMVYQEQVMQVAQACAGYTLGEADLLRRAMGKKIKSEMDKQRDIFVRGAKAGWSEVERQDGSIWQVHSLLGIRTKENPAVRMTSAEMAAKKVTPDEADFIASAVLITEGSGDGGPIIKSRPLNDGLTTDEANHLFDDIDKFSNYGFNKSHAAAYAWIGYQTAWVRHHFPVEFYAALMSYCRRPEKRGMVKDDMTRHGIDLLPPDINQSSSLFKPEMVGNRMAVRYGFCGIKGLPENITWLEEERRINGPFKSLSDFHARTRKRLNKDHMQILAAMGAFSSMTPVRAQAADILAKLEKGGNRGNDLFGEQTDPISNVGEWPDLPEREFKAAGFYMSGHPLDYHMQILARHVHSREKWKRYMRAENEERLDSRLLCVLIKDVQVKQSKRGSTYLQVMAMDQEDTFQINCFPKGSNEEMEELRETLGAAKSSGKPVIMDCDLSLSPDGERLWVNGNAAIPFDDYIEDMDTSNDALVVKIAQIDGMSSKECLDRTAKQIIKILEPMTSADPSRSVEVKLVCSGEKMTIPNRYKHQLAKTALRMQVDGILDITYAAG